MKVDIKRFQIFRRGVPALVAGLTLAPVAIVWDSLPAASASQTNTSTNLFPVSLVGSTSPTLRARVDSLPGTGTPTGTVSFVINGFGPVDCDGLDTNAVSMSGGVATCKITSALPASTSPETAQATYGGDDNFNPSYGTYTSNDGTFTIGASPNPPTTTPPTTTPPTTTPPTTTPPTTTPTTTPPPTTPPSDAMAPPAGYTTQQLIFDDQFSGTRLNTSKWTTLMGANGVIWNNFGTLASGYTGQNSGSGQNGAAVLNASQLFVDNGLTIAAQQNTSGVQQSSYPWTSGVVNTMGKFTLPSTGWYVQAKMLWPDTTAGMWPAMWFMPPSSGPSNELDGFEGGFKNPGLGPQNQLIHYDYFSPAGEMQHMANVGVDMSADYHTYAVEYIPNVSIKYYFDGVLEATTSGVPIPAESYEIMIDLMVALASTSGWHTVPAPGSYPTTTMEIAEVQAYSAS